MTPLCGPEHCKLTSPTSLALRTSVPLTGPPRNMMLSGVMEAALGRIGMLSCPTLRGSARRRAPPDVRYSPHTAARTTHHLMHPAPTATRSHRTQAYAAWLSSFDLDWLAKAYNVVIHVVQHNAETGAKKATHGSENRHPTTGVVWLFYDAERCHYYPIWRDRIDLSNEDDAVRAGGTAQIPHASECAARITPAPSYYRAGTAYSTCLSLLQGPPAPPLRQYKGRWGASDGEVDDYLDKLRRRFPQAVVVTFQRYVPAHRTHAAQTLIHRIDLHAGARLSRRRRRTGSSSFIVTEYTFLP